jgi:hypothetical protein
MISYLWRSRILTCAFPQRHHTPLPILGCSGHAVLPGVVKGFVNCFCLQVQLKGCPVDADAGREFGGQCDAIL